MNWSRRLTSACEGSGKIYENPKKKEKDESLEKEVFEH